MLKLAAIFILAYWKLLIDASSLCKNILNISEFLLSIKFHITFCEAQARVRQGSARDGSQGKRPQSLNPSLELTLKLVVTTTHPKVYFYLTNGQIVAR